ncbi:hypothetical protein [Candidatus Nanopusillus massiliensis]|uniref:hypothetical protein n=1 Tax=Candidatus Nanopusillus massiliensis TaxID=2897163 RepID=UPI001E546826|nr:hypothetical protein [Candidatus Nanopusillus massiliensis]
MFLTFFINVIINTVRMLQIPSSMVLTIINDTNITCNSNRCTFMSTINENSNTYEESSNIYCSPYSNMNSNSLTYNPSVCVELSGFPQNAEVQLSNIEGEIVDAATLGSLFLGVDFPILLLAGSITTNSNVYRCK